MHGDQAGVQIPIGVPVEPVGDFEAEYRGAMAHASSVVQAAAARAQTDLQVRRNRSAG